MKNKRGFTLIELLAVIVILAIIALIATPLVLKYIEKSKNSAAERSANSYVKSVEQAVVAENMSDASVMDCKTCKVQSNGNLLCDGTKTIVVSVKGQVPTSGIVVLDKGNVEEAEFKFGDRTVVVNDNKSQIADTEIDVPIAEETIYLIDKQVWIGYWPNTTAIYESIGSAGIFTKSDTDTMTAKLTYKDGTTEEVTFYYKGKTTLNDYPNRETEYQEDLWIYYVNGNVVKNADGTYTGDTTNGYISIITNAYYEWDFAEIMFYEGRNLLTIKDYNELNVPNELINLRKLEINGAEYKYAPSYVIGQSGYIEGYTQNLKFYENAENVTRLIVTYDDFTQEILENTNPLSTEVTVTSDPDAFFSPIALTFMNEESTFYIGHDNKKRINKVTIEENVNGELVQKSFKIKDHELANFREG